VLRLDGVATVYEAFLDEERILSGESMFQRHVVDVGSKLDAGGRLAIRCRALAPLLERQRKPRVQWRTRLADNNLRWFRTMLLGRTPGFAPGPAAVGPWRPVVVERRRGIVLEDVRVRTAVDGDDGIVRVSVSARALGAGAPAELVVEVGEHSAKLELAGSAELRIPDVRRWWPHTHGEPELYPLFLRLADGEILEERLVGFRELAWADDFERDGLQLRVNAVPIFARGAVWTPVDPVGLAPSSDDLRATVTAARDAGMNMLRVPGISCYENREFHDLCDELGLLVWQDFMFANLDYPIADEGFRALVEEEARAVLDELAARPSLAVLCGNSEVEQQVAMLGLDPGLGRGELFGELLPAWAREAEAHVPYVPSAPSGGELPFRTNRGVANYYGVGGYRRPLADARLAEVRFAAECLALANLPDESGDGFVPRDVGTDWDFADVRDHYLRELFGLDPRQLRAAEPERYAELSRAVSGEVMAEVFGEWRRSASPCRGGLVLWLRDVVPGAGWGLLDREGVPKAAYHHLRRALAPIAVWMTDEGLNGIDVHVANDSSKPLRARLRVASYRDGELAVDEARAELELEPHATCAYNVEELLGRFADVSWAYRFGPPAQDVIATSLETEAGLLAQSFRFPVRRPVEPEPAERLGLAALLEGETLRLTSRRLAYGVRIHLDGCEPADDSLTLEPGRERVVPVRGEAPAGGWLTALNLAGRVPIEVAR
jgi:beta-mannosidase